MKGLITIRAFRAEKQFLENFYTVFDAQVKQFFMFWMASRWLALRLDLIANMIVFSVAVLAVAIANAGNFVDPNLLGLALVYSLQLTGLLQWTVRVTIETENNMTAVERLLVFADIVPEEGVIEAEEAGMDEEAPPLSSTSGQELHRIELEEGGGEEERIDAVGGSTPSKLEATATASLYISIPAHESGDEEVEDKGEELSHHHQQLHRHPRQQYRQHALHPVASAASTRAWPSTGAIEFRNLQVRYRPGLPLVLKGINLVVAGRQKVGVVGRTASGKSRCGASLMNIIYIITLSTFSSLFFYLPSFSSCYY